MGCSAIKTTHALPGYTPYPDGTRGDRLPYIMPTLPSQNNFADLREAANKLLTSTKDDNVKQLAGIVGKLAYRCDLIEREMERLGPGVEPPLGS
jgi:hypothetical protein